MKITPWLRYFVSGKTQSGKSTYMKHALKTVQNYVIWDSVKREFGSFGFIVRDLVGLEAAVKAGHTKIVIQTYQVDIGTFDAFCDWIFKHLRNILFVVDEVQLLAKKSLIGPAFMRLITVGQGQEFRIGIMAAAQRPASVHNDLLGNCTVFVTFTAQIIHDAKAIAQNTGADPEELLRLPQHHFCVYDPRENPSLQFFGSLQ